MSLLKYRLEINLLWCYATHPVNAINKIAVYRITMFTGEIIKEITVCFNVTS